MTTGAWERLCAEFDGYADEARRVKDSIVTPAEREEFSDLAYLAEHGEVWFHALQLARREIDPAAEPPSPTRRDPEKERVVAEFVADELALREEARSLRTWFAKAAARRNAETAYHRAWLRSRFRPPVHRQRPATRDWRPIVASAGSTVTKADLRARARLSFRR